MYSIGVDIGGTNIAIGLVGGDMEIADRVSVPFPHTDGAEVASIVYEQTVRLLSKAGAAPSAVESVGVVVPGSIDATGSVVINAYNLGFHDEPLKARLQDRFWDVPILLANDANGAALAELKKGALAGCTTAALLTLGTGVGGGLILNGRMFNGGMNNGVELGHMILVDGGEPCTCGNRGCIEAYASATAIVRHGQEAALRDPGSMICAGTDPAALDAKRVIDCARLGDAAALSVFDGFVARLGSAVASLLNLLDCECVALGGGVSHAGEFLFAPLRREVDKKCFFKEHGRVVPAVLGNDAGMIGAAMLLWNRS